MNYTHLNVKSHYTQMGSLLTVDTIIKQAKHNNFLACAICDVNSVFGLNELYFKATDIKPLLGIELVFNNDSYILYAKSYAGLKNIFYLSSLVNLSGLDFETFLLYSNDLVCILNKNSLLYNQIVNNSVDQAMYKSLVKTFDKLYFISDEINDDVLAVCKEYALKPLFSYETRYVDDNNKKYFDILQAIKQNALYTKDLTKTKHAYLSSDDIKAFANSLVIANCKEIIASCNVVIPNERLIPEFCKDSLEYLQKLCITGLKKRLTTVSKEYITRLKYELRIIAELKFADYFLIVYDYVKYAKQKGIYVGPGRGSAASSLVSYTLGITNIDPLAYGLLFERFLNPMRISFPDIDIDFEDVHRDELVQYVAKKYGLEHVGQIATFSTFGSKQVLRDVARVLGKNVADITMLTRHVNAMKTLKENYELNSKFRNLILQNVEYEKIYRYALHLEGLVRHNSTHAAGVVISSANLLEVVGVFENQGVNIISANMDNLEKMGLLKMDFLGLRNLSFLRAIISSLARLKISVDLQRLDLNDAKVLALFSNGHTNGIFQYESAGMKSLLMKLKPRSFDDLVAANALHRPGPIDNVDKFVKRAHGSSYEYLTDALAPILQDTYGIIVYQEQIMQIARVIANFSYAKADMLRIAMSKKKEALLYSMKDEFINGSINNGYDEAVAVAIFELILKFANYGFNKAHAVSYSLLGYQLAYLKTYYPIHFMCELLNQSSKAKMFEYINEARLLNIEVISIDINRSSSKFIVRDNQIVMPFTLLSEINSYVSDLIVEEQEAKAFSSFYDFATRILKHELKSEFIKQLVVVGAFDNIEKNSKKSQIHALNGIISMVGFYVQAESDFKYNDVGEYLESELITLEKQALGFNFLNHPTSYYVLKSELSLINVNQQINRNIKLYLYVDSIKEHVTKNNEKMAFLKCSDIYGTIDAVLFPRVYQKYDNLLNKLLYVYCKVEYRNERVQLIINNLVIRGEEHGNSSIN